MNIERNIKKMQGDQLSKTLPSVFFVVGVLCLLILVFLGFNGNKERVLYSYLFAFMSTLSISLGCMIFILLQHVTRAGWSVVVRRVPEAAMNTIPLLFILFLPILFFVEDIYSWTNILHHDVILDAKAPYLNKTFFYIRSGTYFLIWFFISKWFFNKSVLQDKGNYQETSRIMWKISAPSIILFGLSLTFASFDWMMSLQPHWYSTIFGVYYFSGAILGALCFITLVYMLLQKYGFLSNVVTKEHYQDLGKLIFGFIIFWAYIAFSQFILIWYANIPEETEFFIERLDHGWSSITWLLPFIHFFIPFFCLMSKHIKRNKVTLGIVCIYILIVHFIDIYWLIMPNVGSHSVGHYYFSFHIVDLLSLCGMLFLFLSVVLSILRKYALIPNGDPKIKESLSFENF